MNAQQRFKFIAVGALALLATMAWAIEITGTTDQLVKEGLVERVAVPGDRRAFRVKMTPKGREQFAAMALQHERWIVDAFTPLNEKEIASLYGLLNKVKQHRGGQTAS